MPARSFPVGARSDVMTAYCTKIDPLPPLRIGRRVASQAILNRATVYGDVYSGCTGTSTKRMANLWNHSVNEAPDHRDVIRVDAGGIARRPRPDHCRDGRAENHRFPFRI